MMNPDTSCLTRRQALSRISHAAGVAAVSCSLPPSASAAVEVSSAPRSEFVFCLNMATIMGQKLGLEKEIEVAAKAGYQAVEPWIGTIEDFVKAGGSLRDVRKRIEDAGMTVEDGIGFPEWIVDDEVRRAKGLEQAKRAMDLIAQLGGKRLAAPPAGATEPAGLDLGKATERYRALLELGDQMGVVPMLELWGFSKNLNRLSQCVTVAMETDHPKACVLADIFHLYNGGSGFGGLRLLGAGAIQVFHMNDYPADPPLGKINDSYRIFPGDGVAPLRKTVADLRAIGGRMILSLELFNREYWKRDALEVAKEGLAKMKAAASGA